MRTALRSAAALLLLLVAPPLQPQQPPPPPQEIGPPIRVEVELVNVPTSVIDRRRRQVTGLGPDDFRVYEDGVLQEIKHFNSETNLPLRVGLLIDTSGSVRQRFQFEQEAAIDFLHTVLKPGRDSAFVLAFDTSPVLVQDYTDDPLTLAEAIRDLRPGNGTALHDAVYLAANEKLSEGSGSNFRKLVILLSDGDDTSSIVSRTEALEMARRHEVTIFTVSTSAPEIKYSGQSRHLQNPCDVSEKEGDKVLELFSEHTGGTFFCPFSTIDVGQSFERIATELRNQYTLTYAPSNRRADGQFRQIRIELRREGLRAHHRPGYYARRAESTPPSKP